MPLTNMKMTPKEAGTMLCCESASDNTPEYPYGLCINLNTEALERLGIDTLPAVGAVVEITARAVVQSVSSRDDGKPSRNVDLQITDMDVQPRDDSSAAQRLYGASSMSA
ncbi:capsid staple protein [Bordetella hinzii]|uniref:capsid staple protein n=1 Tax=Bordetella hinzii TaxID=103855 RepID=UPI0039FC2F30